MLRCHWKWNMLALQSLERFTAEVRTHFGRLQHVNHYRYVWICSMAFRHVVTLLFFFWKTKQENRITAWKFCYLLHKVLREGHPLCCQHSMRHRELLSNIGKLWVTYEFPLNFACEQTSLTTLNIEKFRVIWTMDMAYAFVCIQNYWSANSNSMIEIHEFRRI